MPKSFKIQYNGADAELEIEDNPRAGVVTRILKEALKFKPNSPLPEPDLEAYMTGLATGMIIKAPWKLGDAQTIKDLPWSTYEQICEILGNEFPLERFLFQAGKLMYGKKLEIPGASPSQTGSTSSSPSSDSPNGK